MRVEVTDADGVPSQAEVAVVVVDEAVVALSNYQLPDPIAAFYARQGNGVSEAHSRSQVVLARPEAADAAPPPPAAPPLGGPVFVPPAVPCAGFVEGVFPAPPD